MGSKPEHNGVYTGDSLTHLPLSHLVSSQNDRCYGCTRFSTAIWKNKSFAAPIVGQPIFFI